MICFLIKGIVFFNLLNFDIMKSSSTTFVDKYISPIVVITMFTFGIYIMISKCNGEILGFTKAIIVAYSWSSYHLIQNLIRLRTIETTENGILIVDNDRQLIEYKDIIWLAKYDLSCTEYVTIKYRDTVSGTEKKIAFTPGKKYLKLFKDDDLTVYIKNMVNETKPYFTREPEPTTMKNFFIFQLLNLPIGLLMLYFLNESIKIL